jgi:hypothetical protein
MSTYVVCTYLGLVEFWSRRCSVGCRCSRLRLDEKRRISQDYRHENEAKVSLRNHTHTQKGDSIDHTRRMYEQHRCSEPHIQGEVDLMFETRRTQS